LQIVVGSPNPGDVAPSFHEIYIQPASFDQRKTAEFSSVSEVLGFISHPFHDIRALATRFGID
jgi:hypothetical protein